MGQDGRAAVDTVKDYFGKTTDEGTQMVTGLDADIRNGVLRLDVQDR